LDCKYFGICGACKVYDGGYAAQLEAKVVLNQERFSHFTQKKIEVFPSKDIHYRSRSEFKIWHKEDDSISYAMNPLEQKEICLIDECPQVSEAIFALMPKLLKLIKDEAIDFKLFGTDFLSASNGSVVVSLLYHKKLDEAWKKKATIIAQNLNISIIGRSRGQKVIIGDDFVVESLDINNETYRFKYIENSFTQPNKDVNEQMIMWSLRDLKETSSDLLELYCGAGNFTIPFAKKFRKVLATEISKSSIAAAKENMAMNSVENIAFVRMGVEEFVQALDEVRVFNRMKDINLEEYDIKTIFVDPPRSGMDTDSCNFAARYENIIYISCNPETLVRDLEILTLTHAIDEIALFDQFPYTYHAEMGVKLTRKEKI
jgi:tRNA (uracil-5-)-methyltransferase